MSKDVTVDGVTYISSKRAAEMSHYTQDYIGQLARAGKIDGRRIEGLWYVRQDSLEAHKAKTDAYVPQPPIRDANSEQIHSDSYVGLDGRRYVSAAKGADITGYHQDYIGQLARSQKLISQQIGTRWYVEADGLKEHKAEKDRLLGAVQAESVGLRRFVTPKEAPKADAPQADLHFTYIHDTSRLLPLLEKKELFQNSSESNAADEGRTIPIHVIRSVPRAQSKPLKLQKQSITIADSPSHRPGNTRNLLIFLGVLVTILLVLAIGVGQLQQFYNGSRSGSPRQRDSSAISNTLTRMSRTLDSFFITLFAHQVTYQRTEQW